MSKTIWVGVVAYDPKVVTIWEGMRNYFHDEAHLPAELFSRDRRDVGDDMAA